MTTHQVYVYGELARRSTLLQVIGREPIGVKATLRGYELALDPDIDYYVAVRKEGGSIEGKLLTGITDAEMRALDEFEGASENLFERVIVEVDVEGGKTRAYLYVKHL